MQKISLANGGFAIIDEDDADKVAGYRWLKSPLGYAVAYFKNEEGQQKAVLMHRLIMDAAKGVSIDHRSHDTLDNRRENLRTCTHAENMKNRKMHRNNRLGIKGVYYDASRPKNPYRALIRVDGKKIMLGRFTSVEDAHAAYVQAAHKYHGEFACAGT